MSELEEKQFVTSSFTPPHASFRAYIEGFIACVVLTLAAYLATTQHWFSRDGIIFFVAVLALVQCILQLMRFLHLGQEFKPRWKLLIFAVMLSMVLILVIGSLWIMDNLNYRMMQSPAQSNQYLQGQDGL